MKNVGLLVTKNEGPILKETLKANTRYIKDIYALYGGDDGTEEILKSFKEIKYCINESELIEDTSFVGRKEDAGGSLPVSDGIRGVLLKEIKKAYEIGDWVTLLHGDEIFYHDPNTAVALAALNKFNVVLWYAPHFFFAREDLKNWDSIKDKPLEKKMSWYATNQLPWKECRQFQIQEDSCYNINEHARVMPYMRNLNCLPVCPTYKHYKVWNLDLDDYEVVYSKKYARHVSKAKEKWGCLHWEINKFEDFFIEFYPGYEQKHQFLGDFGTFEVPFNTALDGLRQYLRRNQMTLQDIVANAPNTLS